MEKSFRQLMWGMIILSLAFSACGPRQVPSEKLISDLSLKRGQVPTCGPPEKKLGSVAFQTSCGEAVRKDFDLALALLHSFEYDEAEKTFARVIDKEPGCPMAYWGVAMSNFHPLWSPPSGAELEKGLKAVRIGQSLSGKSAREAAYLDAVSAFYTGYEKADHRVRCARFEKAMQKLYTSYPSDAETAIFYALALNGAADPADKSYSKQKKAGEILNKLYIRKPDHPGIVHYIIHTYDSPELAGMALPAARRYASLAPSSAHALHMPSHIFTRLGIWQESIHSNLASVASAKCYAESVGISGHWDEELHGLDYLVYAYLQRGQNDQAKKQWDYLNSMKKVEPVNFKVAYAFASVPSRYLLENKRWKEAAALQPQGADLAWTQFPWEGAIIHFARLLGSAHTGDMPSAKTELAALRQAHERLLEQRDTYKANQVQIQIKASEALILFRDGKTGEAIDRMALAADMEDQTAKHPVTPCEVLPARELLGDLLLQMDQPEKAFTAYEADLKKNPNRFNGLYGAGLAAERSGRREKARYYYRKLLDQAEPGSGRRELTRARDYLEAKLALR
ncbi:MAG TPA: tetratricopeptide repeat protein [Sphingobacteriaceae bacterium]